MSDLDQLSSPFADEPGGIDPAYEDAFVTVKNEINKLQSNDYSLIHDLSWKILTETSKDLRVAGYYILAATFTQGIQGLVKGIQAYEILTSKFWDSCHPKRPRAKEASLKWLNNAKLETFAKEYATGGSNEEYKTIQAGIAKINHYATALDSEEIPVWNVLDKWLKDQIVEEPDEEEITQPAVESTTPVPKPAPEQTTAPTESLTSGAITSDQDVINLTRSIRDYLIDKKEYVQAVSFSRALRWGNLKIPPSENHKTRLAPMRAGAMAQLANAQANEDPLEVFLLSENLFLEPGGQVNLDIQYAASTAAAKMGQLGLCDFIVAQVQELVARLPELQQLQFDNGEPFASSETKQWLEEHRAQQDSGSSADHPSEDDVINPIVIQARELAAKKKLSQGLSLLQGVRVNSPKDKLIVKLHMAELCQNAKRHDMALPVLNDLQERIQSQSLHIWDSPLAAKIYGQLIQTLEALMNKTPKNEKPLLEQQVSYAKSQLCKIDLAEAAKFF